MNTSTNRWLIAAALMVGAACNPYPSPTKGPPQVVRVVAFDSAPGDGQDAPATVDTPTAGSYFFNNVSQGSYGYNYAFSVNAPKRFGAAIEVQFNKPLDGASVQATSANCTPAAGAFTFDTVPTSALPAGEAWYVCYNPGNPDVTVGGSIVIFKGQTAPASRMNDPRHARYEAATNYHVTGTVRDQQGNPVSFDVTFNVSAEKLDPFGISNDGGYTLTANAGGTITIDWVGSFGGQPDGAQSYDIERAPNVVDPFNGDVPGTFATIQTGIAAATATFTDTPGGASGTNWWYRMTTHGTNGTTVTGSPGMVTTAP